MNILGIVLIVLIIALTVASLVTLIMAIVSTVRKKNIKRSWIEFGVVFALFLVFYITFSAIGNQQVNERFEIDQQHYYSEAADKLEDLYDDESSSTQISTAEEQGILSPFENEIASYLATKDCWNEETMQIIAQKAEGSSTTGYIYLIWSEQATKEEVESFAMNSYISLVDYFGSFDKSLAYEIVFVAPNSIPPTNAYSKGQDTGMSFRDYVLSTILPE